ncbi:MAG: hypothetical protein ABJF10_13665 [Chthoniobacter sp.]
MVDTALNLFPGTTDVAALADSAGFHAACKETNKLFRYPIESWEPPLARLALSDTRLSGLYVDRQVRAALADLKVDPNSLRQLLPDVAGMVLTFWAELAPGYEVGTIIGDDVVTWGYEAYLARRLTPMVAHGVARGLRWSWSTRPIIDEDREKIAAKRPVDRWEGHLRCALTEALDSLITDESLYNAYFALAFSEEPMGEVAINLGMTYHLLHSRLIQPLCVRIARAADEAMNGHVRICTELRAALAEVFPLDAFVARYHSQVMPEPANQILPKENATPRSNSEKDSQ